MEEIQKVPALLVWEYIAPEFSQDIYRLDSGNTLFIDYVQVLEEVKRNVKGGIANTELEGIMWVCTPLPDGSILASFHNLNLICEAMEGKIWEVTADGRVAWVYVNPAPRWGNVLAHIFTKQLQAKSRSVEGYLWSPAVFGSAKRSLR